MSTIQVGDELVFVLPVPVRLTEFTQYAFVCLTTDAPEQADDDIHSLDIAELGKFDQINGPVRQQPNNEMVGITSSNNTAFVFHHDWDLWVKIYEAEYSQTEKEITLGTVDVTDATDLCVFAGVQDEGNSTGVDFICELTAGDNIELLPNQPAALTQSLTDTLTIKAVLKGALNETAILFPHYTFVSAKLEPNANYQSRAFKCGDNRIIRATTIERATGTATITIKAKDSAGVFQTCVETASVSIGDGWFEKTREISGVTAPTTAIEITLTGTAKDRPMISQCVATSMVI
ncbi:MAG: hypothetical protein JKY10_09580 [Cohaesibacteraceae bacterium]|nr:hypothetical protein [Cohaesibacteraceae bacterium]